MPFRPTRLPDGPSPMRALAQWLLDSLPVTDGIADASRVLVLVPASRATRSFEAHWAALARERGVAAVAPHVATPGRFAQRFVVPRSTVLGPLAVRQSWREAIGRTSEAVLRALAGSDDGLPDRASRDAMAKRVGDLFVEVASGCRGFSEVAVHLRGKMPDMDLARWDALAELESVRDRLLADAGACDPLREVLDAVRGRGEVSPGNIETVVILLADPEPLQREVLRTLSAAGVDVRVMVHGLGDAMPAPVDGEGFPVHAEWAGVDIAVDDAQVFLADAPVDQAAAVMDALAAFADESKEAIRSDDVAIAVPDPQVAAEVVSQLPAWGVRVVAPPGRLASDSSLGLLLDAMRAWIEDRRCEGLAALCLHPDIDRLLAASGMPDAPVRVRAFAAATGCDRLPHSGFPPSMAPISGIVGQVDELVRPILHAHGAGAAAAAVRAVLDACVLDDGSPASRDARRALLAGVEELESLHAELGGTLEGAGALRLLRDSMRARTLPSDGTDDGIELMGWLEAGVDDAPYLVVTGMNDGIVPEGMVVDPWLPDSVRAQLGMPSALRRQARDAWILHFLLGRKKAIRLVTGRVTALGEPLRPSRLLLGARGPELAGRVLRMVDEHSPRASASRWARALPREGGFRPVPVPQGDAPIRSLSVTAFRDWFRSPALLRLRQDPRLRLREGQDVGGELDSMGFGNLVHAVLEEWGRGEIARIAAGDPPTTEREEIESDVLRVFDRLRQAKGMPQVRGAYEVQFALVRERLAAFARVQAERAEDGWQPIHVELTFTPEPKEGSGARPAPPLGTSGILLTGRIDRVDFHPQHGYAALDYKTSAEAKDPAAEHRMSRSGRWKDLQLPLYAVLLRSIGIEPSPSQLGYFALPSNPDGSCIRRTDGWDAGLVADAVSCAETIAGRVAAGDFSADPAWGHNPEWKPDRADAFALVWGVGMRGLRAVPRSAAAAGAGGAP